MQHALYLSLPTLILPAPNLANRAFIPAYARAVSNLLAIGGPNAYTNISIRIPVSDPQELINHGPAAGPGGGPSNGRHHRRMSSLSSRPSSMHQQQLSLGTLGALTAAGVNVGSAGGPPLGGSRVASVASGVSGTFSSKSMTHAALHEDPSSTWEMWDCIRSLCGYHPRLSVSKYSNALRKVFGC